ncbi:alpha/beta hydrolase [Rivibacter subsaxonicus]|uniref:Putative alpha/beta superfamily hydrolase n=1 Tax=Rivibacter subsaxonicus TaxID=457575 RepID=A0A4Q7VD77_9BURK|nr:alpha/beta hydrolase-fold protein [Rivibacter subsaxonicus]RZT93650.1 putative alpha/beta superfamily hydrolase [Rivibacter subsaxonicus]
MRALAANALIALLVCAGVAPASAGDSPSARPGVSVLAPPLRIAPLGRDRTLRIYLPPSYAQGQRRYPVIYMHDGQNLFDAATSFAGEWGVDETLDELARSKGFEAIVVGIDHGGDRRTTELNPWDHPRFGRGEGEAYLDFVVEVVKPFIDARYRTRPEPASTAIIGSSLGGLISHYAIHRHPQVFGKAGVFSPAYWVAPAIYDYVREHPLPATARVELTMGGREGSEPITDVRRMQALLAQAPATRGQQLVLEPQAEHNEAAWRARFGPTVIRLFDLPD